MRSSYSEVYIIFLCAHLYLICERHIYQPSLLQIHTVRRNANQPDLAIVAQSLQVSVGGELLAAIDAVPKRAVSRPPPFMTITNYTLANR
jgi:hypothetical protein